MYFSPKIEEIVSLQKYQDEWSLDYDTSRDYEKNHKTITWRRLVVFNV